jgi:hypothetical protein
MKNFVVKTNKWLFREPKKLRARMNVCGLRVGSFWSRLDWIRRHLMELVLQLCPYWLLSHIVFPRYTWLHCPWNFGRTEERITRDTCRQFHQHFTYSFYASRSQKCQMTLLTWLSCFAHSGSMCVKAVCRTLTKLSPVVNFINILLLCKSKLSSFSLIHLDLQFFGTKILEKGRIKC